jgi:signal transduction histidine kinase/CheY-like chemotaxis protein
MLKSQIKFALLACIITFFITLAGVSLEDLLHNIPLEKIFSNAHHYITPLLLGIASIVFGIWYGRLYNRKKDSEKALVQESENLHLLLSLSQEMLSTLETNKLLQTIIEQATWLTHLDSGAIYLCKDDQLYLGATTPPLPPGFPEELRIGKIDDHPNIRKSFIAKVPHTIRHMETEQLSPMERVVCEQRGLKSLLYVPLIIENKEVGIFILGTIYKIREFTAHEIDLYRTISTQVALVIENSKLFQETRDYVAELQQQNKKIVQLNRELADSLREIRRMNADLTNAREIAEKSEKIKSSFLRNMSHEVRTPLNAIFGFSQLLGENRDSPEKIALFSEIIATSSNKLLGIITDVIDASKLVAGDTSPELQEFDLVPLIERIIDESRHKITNPKTILLPQICVGRHSCMVFTDRYKLEKIISHLLDNAIKFTPEGNISFDLNAGQDGLSLSVSDTGSGIPAELHQIVFDAFQQYEHEGSAILHGGTGLGLTIVKGFTDAMQGTIRLESEVNKGTRISIKIPPPMFKLINTLEQGDVKSIQQQYTLLVVEDEATNYLYLAEALKDVCSEMIHASNGLQAVDICRSHSNIDAVLMDIKMPVMDGYTATKKIREFSPAMPIIAQTAYAIPAENNEGNNIRLFDEVVNKPINIEDLKRKIHSITLRKASRI